MSDRSATCIGIGGTIPLDHIEELVDSIEVEGCGPEWSGGTIDREHVKELIKEAVDAGEALKLFDNEASGGQFQDLEITCRKLGLAYHRCDDGHYAYPATHEAWFPGMAEPISGAGQIDEGPHIPLRELMEAVHDPRKVEELARKYEPLVRPIPPLVIQNA